MTLAGAKRDDERDDLAAMLRLAARLRADGVPVSALRYEAPSRSSLFHAKFVCGERGYLGSANLTGPGLGEHVEAGLPLAAEDIARVWWLVDVLRRAGVLEEM